MKKPERAGSHPGASEAEEDALVWRAIESLGGAVIVVDVALRVVGATRAAARMLGAPIRSGAHVVRILAGDAAPLIADAFAGDRAVVASIPSGDAAHEVRARVRATPLREGARHVGWIVRLTQETTGRGEPQRFESMWTRSEPMRRVFAIAELVADCDASVLVSGEMGVGKASLAAAIHARSSRRSHPLRTLPCAAMSPVVLERQLVARRPEDAASTLLLDEVGELPHEAQGYLLRVLESGFVTPIDGGARVPVDVRTIATTSRSLDREVDAGRFRADLLVHLRTVALELPPLRTRPLDVPLLAEKFLAEMAPRCERETPRLSDEALARLQRYDWPGNVRELRAAIESALATGRGPVVAAADLPDAVAEPGGAARELMRPAPLEVGVATDEASRIRRALERTGGDRTRAAAMLGVSRSTLWRRMRTHGLTSR